MNTATLSSLPSSLEPFKDKPWVQKNGGPCALASDPTSLIMKHMMSLGTEETPVALYETGEAYPPYLLEKVPSFGNKYELLGRLKVLAKNQILQHPNHEKMLACFYSSLETESFNKRLDKAIYFYERPYFIGYGDADRSFRAAFDVVRQAENLKNFEDPYHQF